MKYRYDLELLKGYSILFIILYHNELPIFKYGYVSVIVFINISGYLSSIKVSKNILKSITNRYIRITPSYYFSLIFTIFYLIKQNILNENDVDDSLYIFLYIFNIRLINNSNDYFQKENTSPFIHLWYISVIFQLYIIQISILNIINNVYSNTTFVIFSFIYDLYCECYLTNNVYYYNTLIRLWYYFLPLCMKFYIMININITAMLVVFLNLYKLENIFINIIILSLVSNSACNYIYNDCNYLLFNRCISYLGKISYSLYLYHYIFIHYKNRVLYNIIISIIVAIFNHLIVERNIRKYGIIVFTILVMCIMKMNNEIHKSIKNKLVDNNLVIIKSARIASSQLWCSHCHLHERDYVSKYNILLMGDSHLEQWIAPMLHYTKSHGIMMHYFYIHLDKDDYISLYNKYFGKNRIKWILVILSFVMSHYPINNNEIIRNRIIDIINFYNSFIPSVLYIEDSPSLYKNNICQKCYEKHNIDCNLIVGKNVTVYKRIIPQLKNTHYISFNDKICFNKICPCIINKISVYDTMSHLCPLFTEKFYTYFNELFSKILNVNYTFNKSLKVCNFYVYGKYYYRKC